MKTNKIQNLGNGIESPLSSTKGILHLISEKLCQKSANILHLVAMQKYQNAKITVRLNGETYIEWYNMHPVTGKLTRLRKSFDLGRIKELDLRQSQAIQIQSAINLALANGWNYFESKSVANHLKLTLTEALKKSMQIVLDGLSKETIRTYPSLMNIFIKWLKQQKIDDIEPKEFTTYHFTQFLATRDGKSVSNINKYIIVLKKLFKTMKEVLCIIEKNPIENIKARKVIETDRFEPITPDELKIISNRLKNDNEHAFLLYTQFILFAFIRPGHLKYLQRSQIDFENNTIQIFGTSTKSKRNVKKQLLVPLKQALIDSKVHLLHPDEYIFGKNFEPSQKIYHTLETRAQEKWKLLVESLGIDKRMYSLKHTGAQMYIENNEVVDVSWLQKQMEHSTLAETEKYVSKRKMKILDGNKLNLPDY